MAHRRRLDRHTQTTLPAPVFAGHGLSEHSGRRVPRPVEDRRAKALDPHAVAFVNDRSGVSPGEGTPRRALSGRAPGDPRALTRPGASHVASGQGVRPRPPGTAGGDGPRPSRSGHGRSPLRRRAVPGRPGPRREPHVRARAGRATRPPGDVDGPGVRSGPTHSHTARATAARSRPREGFRHVRGVPYGGQAGPGTQPGRPSVRSTHAAGGVPALPEESTPPTMAQVVSMSPPTRAVVQKARS